MPRSPLVSASTFSKDIRTWSGDPAWQPTEIVEGNGCRVLGNDGRWYVDYVASLGSVVLGHAHPEFCERVARQVWKGCNYSLPSRLERIVADKLVSVLGAHVPGWSGKALGVRFVLSGSDACEAALRLARKATGRRWCLSVGYHGCSPGFIGLTPPAWGIVPDPYMATFPYGDIDALDLLIQQTSPAAVIYEVLPQSVPDGYWMAVRRLCDENGTLLIADEVVTGWRFAMAGAVERYGIRPDIAVYAKALANGVPFGAIVGDRDLFDAFDLPSPVFISGTGLGHSLGLAAADAVLDIWNEAGVAHLWKVGQRLIHGFLRLGFDVLGQPPRFLVQFKTPAERAFFIVGMRDRGILFNRPVLVTLAHTEADVDQTVAAAAEVKALMDQTDVESEMAGKLPAVLFSNR